LIYNLKVFLNLQIYTYFKDTKNVSIKSMQIQKASILLY